MSIAIMFAGLFIAAGIYLGLEEIAKALRNRHINVTLPPIQIRYDDGEPRDIHDLSQEKS